MKSRKTRSDERGTYTYECGYGSSVTLKPGEYGVTELHIDYLNRLDDREVDGYWRYIRPKRTAEEKSKIEEWKQNYIEKFKIEHGYEPLPEYVEYVVKEAFPMKYATSLNAYETEDKNLFLVNAKMLTDVVEDADSRMERLHEVVKALNPYHQELYQDLVINQKSQTEVAAERGVSKQAISKSFNCIKSRIKEFF